MTSKPEPEQKGGDAGRVQLAVDSDIVLPCSCALAGDDITLYFKKDQFLKTINKAIKGRQQRVHGSPFTIDVSGPALFWTHAKALTRNERDSHRFIDPRIHASSAFGGEYYSVTIRSKNGGDSKWAPKSRDILPEHMDANNWERATGRLGLSSISEKSWKENIEKFWGTQCSVAEILYGAIFPAMDPSAAAGLVLITGGTGTGKTTILNAIAARYLHRMFESNNPQKWKKPERRPHVVVAGDPVETLFHAGTERRIQDCGASQLAPFEDQADCQQKREDYFQRRIDFTARMIGTDVPSVSFALKDALRETPALYIVSELREDDDFKATLKFAESGQLIFATSHSTSLVDAMRKLIMLSWGEDTSHTRSLLAQRLKAVIHLKKTDEKGKGLTLPSLWVGNAAGVRQFVCDGLSSLLPGGAVDDRDGQPKGALGRAWAAGKLFTDPELISAAHTLDLSIH